MVIIIKDHVNHCYTAQDGQIVFDCIFPMLKSKKKFLLDFKGIDAVSSTFVNIALIRLLNYFSFSEVKNMIGFVGSNKNINLMIKDRFTFEATRQKDKISA